MIMTLVHDKTAFRQTWPSCGPPYSFGPWFLAELLQSLKTQGYRINFDPFRFHVDHVGPFQQRDEHHAIEHYGPQLLLRVRTRTQAL